MDSEVLVSVIMSVYNEKVDWLNESIKSILNQSMNHLEFIIILDNPDNLELKKVLEKFKSDSRIKLIINEKNLGLVKSLNIALKHCRGKYIARMDADDISLKDRLELQIDYLEKEDLDFVYSGISVIDESGNFKYTTDKNKLSHIKVKKLLETTNCSYHPTWMVKKDVYLQLNGYREIKYCEDYDFSLRSLDKGYKIGKMNSNILKYRIRSNSVSRSYSLEQYLNMYNILRLYKNNNLYDQVEIKKILDITQKKLAVKEIENFKLAEIEANEGITLLKNRKYFKGIIKISRSIFKSKYYFHKMSNYFLYTIKK